MSHSRKFTQTKKSNNSEISSLVSDFVADEYETIFTGNIDDVPF